MVYFLLFVSLKDNYNPGTYAAELCAFVLFGYRVWNL